MGLLGIAVQLGILAALTLGLGWNYLVSTFLAVEITILHNFVWHERWTWVDKTNGSVAGRLGRLLRFHAANGAVSLLGNLVLMWLFVGILHVQPVIANICSITICSLVNFLASDRWVFGERSGDSMTRSKPNGIGGEWQIGKWTLSADPRILQHTSKARNGAAESPSS